LNQDSFKDYYEDLQVSANADQETIEKVFRHLAKRFHPDNGQTGDFERFNELSESYQVLSDPVKRAAYDAGYESIRNLKWKLTTQSSHPGGPEGDSRIRSAILGILYAARRRSVSDPGVGILYLEQVLECPQSQMEFHLWYLKEKGWLQRTDKGAFAITAGGVDAYEGADHLLRKDRLITDGKVQSPPANGDGKRDGERPRLLPDPELHEGGGPGEPPHTRPVNAGF
jgi:curved DNA-binding protein CbpA